MNKNLLILGASSETGIAFLRAYAREYDRIFLHYRRKNPALEELAEQLGDKAVLCRADLSSREETERFAEEMSREEISHVLHLPAGGLHYRRFPKLSWDGLSGELDIQVRSLFCVLQKLLPGMAKQKYGKVAVLLTSCTHHIPPACLADYVTAKYALLGLVKALSAEYAGKQVTINAVSPSMMETRFLEEVSHLTIEQAAANAPLKRNARVEEVIPMLEFLLSDQSSYMTGQNVLISGGNLI